MQNLETLLRKTMVLVFRKAGLSQQQADDKATEHMAEAVVLFQSKYLDGSGDKTAMVAAANREVTRWAESL